MDAVSEIKGRLSIEDVVGEYIQLKRAGKNYKALSPFSNEKTPSFVVSPEKQIWHDFSSGRGGDMFTFIQETEGVDFKGALELLARKAGVDLAQFQNSGRHNFSGPNKERLFEVLEEVLKFYQRELAKSMLAQDYLSKKRKFNDHTIKIFGLGFSPNSPRAATDHLLNSGFKEDELKLAGISVDRQGRLGDMFRGRLMVPLCDPFGRVVGFTARLLDESGSSFGPKYINTASTPLYDKSRHIYGLHLAKKSIQSSKFAILVEGNLDVIASHQAGVSNTVATAGTALTDYQLKQLGRLTPDVRLAFDQDQAGIAAAERAIPMASKAGVDLSMVTIENGKDPDELIKQDPSLWQETIKNPVPALDWLLGVYRQRLDIASAQGKRKYSDVALAVVKNLPDTVEQDHYIQQVAADLEVSAQSLRQKLQGFSVEKPLKKHLKTQNKFSTATAPETKRAQDHFLSIMLMQPSTRHYLSLVSPIMLTEKPAQDLLKFLQENTNFQGDLTKDHPLQPISDYVKILSLQFEELYGEIDTTELHYEAARLRAKIIEHFVKKQKQLISDKLKIASKSESNELLTLVNKLNQLIKRTQE